MNDFLQSLRNGQVEKTRTPKTRKNSDNSYHYTSTPRFHSYGGYQNHRNQAIKRPSPHYQTGNQSQNDDVSTTSLLAEAIENLNNHVEGLAKNQDYLITIQERTADLIERQAIAIEKIVDHLNIAPRQQTEPEKQKTLQKTFKPLYASHEKPESEIGEPDKNIAPPEQAVEPAKPKKPVVRRRRKKVVAKQAAPADKKLLSREAVMDIIHSMRAKGDTFDMVASRLVELGQPTFSGRGEWHAQTIHRLCNKK